MPGDRQRALPLQKLGTCDALLVTDMQTRDGNWRQGVSETFEGEEVDMQGRGDKLLASVCFAVAKALSLTSAIS